MVASNFRDYPLVFSLNWLDLAKANHENENERSLTWTQAAPIIVNFSEKNLIKLNTFMHGWNLGEYYQRKLHLISRARAWVGYFHIVHFFWQCGSFDLRSYINMHTFSLSLALPDTHSQTFPPTQTRALPLIKTVLCPLLSSQESFGQDTSLTAKWHPSCNFERAIYSRTHSGAFSEMKFE